MSKIDLKQKIDELPMLPSVVAALLNLKTDDQKYFDRMLSLSEYDPSLALKVIKLANSRCREGLRPVINLKDAVVRVGVVELHNLVASIAVTGVFLPVKDAEKRLWQHSLEVATICRAFSEQVVELRLDKDTAYLVGLLHDIGLMLRFGTDMVKFNHIDDYPWKTPEQHIKVDSAIFGTNHADLGAYICKSWNLPAPLPAIIKLHHSYQLAPELLNQNHSADLTRVLQLADLCSEYYGKLANEPFRIDDLDNCIAEIEPLAQWLEKFPKLKHCLASLPDYIELANEKYEAAGN